MRRNNGVHHWNWTFASQGAEFHGATAQIALENAQGQTRYGSNSKDNTWPATWVSFKKHTCGNSISFTQSPLRQWKYSQASRRGEQSSWKQRPLVGSMQTPLSPLIHSWRDPYRSFTCSKSKTFRLGGSWGSLLGVDVVQGTTHLRKDLGNDRIAPKAHWSYWKHLDFSSWKCELLPTNDQLRV